MRDPDDGESDAARLIADAQLAATRAPARGGAQIGLINGTGVRTSLVPDASGALTYARIFALQPFGNNLVVKTLSGAELKAVLEQQFDGGAGKPATVKSLLIPSRGFTFTYDLSRPAGERIRSMRLNGRPVDPRRDYR
ncbi:5'-nucleotidase C-terminal domain-containing protein, partial [Bradyrhizobium sp. NBAIM08]|uniref:5'-nucleotidase C-terminal domain-containing protein n=1 Tax=Bradyrhizobium sp. NBAIM08 TaxID=2793815 RepID=UPI001CD239C2